MTNEMIAEKLEALEGRLKALEAQRLPLRAFVEDLERAGSRVDLGAIACPHEALIMLMAGRLYAQDRPCDLVCRDGEYFTTRPGSAFETQLLAEGGEVVHSFPDWRQPDHVGAEESDVATAQATSRA